MLVRDFFFYKTLAYFSVFHSINHPTATLVLKVPSMEGVMKHIFLTLTAVFFCISLSNAQTTETTTSYQVVSKYGEYGVPWALIKKDGKTISKMDDQPIIKSLINMFLRWNHFFIILSLSNLNERVFSGVICY